MKKIVEKETGYWKTRKSSIHLMLERKAVPLVIAGIFNIKATP